MALVPKDKTLQIRLPVELLEAFRGACDRNAVVGSELVRRWIQHYVDQEAKRNAWRGQQSMPRAYEAPVESPVASEPPVWVPEPKPEAVVAVDRRPAAQVKAEAARLVDEDGEAETRQQRRERERRERKGR